MGGDIKVQYFLDGQFGGECELVELMQVGVVDIIKVLFGLMESFLFEYGVFLFFYLFVIVDEYYCVMDNLQVMEFVYQFIVVQGFIGVGWYDFGVCNFYMSKVLIKCIEDLCGKKICVMQSEMVI